MRFRTLNSGSKGNCYLLESDNGECLVLEAGVKFSMVTKALNFKLNDIRACVVSHAHRR
jgi:phosphoribosyl 1,2-cyclic phosphodiesterase